MGGGEAALDRRIQMGKARLLSLKSVHKKYSEGYLKILEENPWVQSYRKTKWPWQDEYNGWWLPDLQHLWWLVELNTQEPISLEKRGHTYILRTSKIKMYGECPEEAMLKLFISLETSNVNKEG